jgi:hypothetical protein
MGERLKDCFCGHDEGLAERACERSWWFQQALIQGNSHVCRFDPDELAPQRRFTHIRRIDYYNRAARIIC